MSLGTFLLSDFLPPSSRFVQILHYRKATSLMTYNVDNDIVIVSDKGPYGCHHISAQAEDGHPCLPNPCGGGGSMGSRACLNRT